jgi:UDP-hydrolysing UDP-N-acetyl-D-glucosamine 2-epimerase
MKTIAIVISARASYSRIRSALIHLSHASGVNLRIVIVASGSSSRFGSLEDFIKRDGLEIAWKIDSQLDTSHKASMAKTVGLTLLGLTDYLMNLQIDGVVVIADRHETIAASISGSYLGIKTFHIQGGERTGNIDDKVRYANSHLSDYHFVSNQKALERLIDCGIDPTKIFVTGCPSLDSVPVNKFDFEKIPSFTGIGLSSKEVFIGEYLVVIQHPETTSNLKSASQISPTIDAIDAVGIPALWIWPNSDLGGDEIVGEIRKAREHGQLKRVHFERSVEPEIFLRILDGAACVIGNSSVALRECSLIGTPAVNIGGRQRDRDHGSNVLSVQYDSDEIREAIKKQMSHGRFAPEVIYGSGESGKLISRLIQEIA